MSNLETGFIDRIRAGIDPRATSLVRFITEETYIMLKQYSFFGHEFQQYFVELIEKDPNIDITAEKCSQIGLSEVCFRIVMGLMALNPGYSIIYAMPSKSFAMEVLKTRISPIIDGSPLLRMLISSEVDSASVKMFKNGSILFALGASAQSSQSLINRPVALALTDELDKCDYNTHSGLRSRQTHSKYKPRIAISTPTVPGVGINAEAKGRQLHYQIVICHSCKHEYIPDYYEQVRLPGFDAPIATLDKEKVNKFDLDVDKAYHCCPKCHKPSKLGPEHRSWVIDNQQSRKIHLRLTPFDAPSFITVPDLVTSQLTYSSRAEFDNQALGLPCKLADASINPSVIEFTNDEAPSGIPVAGLDLGKQSHFMKGVLNDDLLFIDFTDVIPVGELEKRIDYNILTQRVVSIVSDSLPFLDVVHRLTQKYAYFWGAIYSVPREVRPELFKLKINEEEKVRQVSIQKNLFMDHVAGLIANGKIVFKRGPMDESIVSHLTDMRRVRDYDYTDIRYKWVKSRDGNDHWWHCLCYLVAASKLLQKLSNSTTFPLSQLVTTFKNRSDV